MFTLETIVDKFGEEMAPYALGLCQNLVSYAVRGDGVCRARLSCFVDSSSLTSPDRVGRASDRARGSVSYSSGSCYRSKALQELSTVLREAVERLCFPFQRHCRTCLYFWSSHGVTATVGLPMPWSYCGCCMNWSGCCVLEVLGVLRDRRRRGRLRSPGCSGLPESYWHYFGVRESAARSLPSDGADASAHHATDADNRRSRFEPLLLCRARKPDALDRKITLVAQRMFWSWKVYAEYGEWSQ